MGISYFYVNLTANEFMHRLVPCMGNKYDCISILKNMMEYKKLDVINRFIYNIYEHGRVTITFKVFHLVARYSGDKLQSASLS